MECCHRVAQPSEETLNERLVFPAHLAEQVNTFVHVRHCVGKHLFDRIGVREFRPADCIAVRLQLFRRELLPAADVIHHLAVQFRVVAAEPMQVLMPEYPRRRLRSAAVDERDALVIEAAQVRRTVKEYDPNAHLLTKLLHSLLALCERVSGRELDVFYHLSHTALCRCLAIAEKRLSLLQEGVALVLVLEQEAVLCELAVVSTVSFGKLLDRSVVFAEERLWTRAKLDLVRLGMLVLVRREVRRLVRHAFHSRLVQLYSRSRCRFSLADVACIIALRHGHVLHAVEQVVDAVNAAQVDIVGPTKMVECGLMRSFARVAVKDDDMCSYLRASARERYGRKMDIRNRNDFGRNLLHHLAIALVCGRAFRDDRDDAAAVMQLLECLLQVFDSRLATRAIRRVHGDAVELVDDVEVLERTVYRLCPRRIHLCQRHELARRLYNRALRRLREPARDSAMTSRRFQRFLAGLETEPFHHLIADRLRRCEVVVAFLRLRPRRALLVSEVERLRAVILREVRRHSVVHLFAARALAFCARQAAFPRTVHCFLIQVTERFAQATSRIANGKILDRGSTPANRAGEHVLLDIRTRREVAEHSVRRITDAVDAAFNLHRIRGALRHGNVDEHARVLARRVMQ